MPGPLAPKMKTKPPMLPIPLLSTSCGNPKGSWGLVCNSLKYQRDTLKRASLMSVGAKVRCQSRAALSLVRSEFQRFAARAFPLKEVELVGTQYTLKVNRSL